MNQLSLRENQFYEAESFEELVSAPYIGNINAICWKRELRGDFSEIVRKVITKENILELDEIDLYALELSEQGQVAREILVSDLSLLREHGASPILNLIKCYDRDETNPYFATDVYSFHVDRSPVATDTFLCTYYGDTSEILPNAQAQQKVLIPEIRDSLKKQYNGTEEGFENYLKENFFDLHYQAKPEGAPISMGLGHIWRLAVDHPGMEVLPCVHRAPKEQNGKSRLLLIC
jgi:hypothetical protein